MMTAEEAEKNELAVYLRGEADGRFLGFWLGMAIGVAVSVLAVLTGGCSLGTLPPPETPPVECTSAQHAWENFHLAHDSLSPVVVNNSGYTPDLESWNRLDTPIHLRGSGDGFRIFISEGGDADSSWLGLASVRVDGRGHILLGTVTMNRTLLSRYGPNVAAHVLAQEIGHLLGLGHQRNAVPPSAMDDCVGRGSGWLACLSDPAGLGPNAHDAEQLREIYAHVVGGPRAPPKACGTGEVTYRVHAFSLPGESDHHEHTGRSSQVDCHNDSTCESTAKETDDARDGSDDTEAAPAAQREGAGGGHREGPAASSDGIHPGGGRGDGAIDAQDAERAGTPVGGEVDRVAHVDPVVQLWLARAAVGECDFMLPDCHAATWGTLQRRLWTVILPQWPRYTLDKLVRKYCAPFRGKPDARERWLRGLEASGKPRDWPSNLDWDHYAPHWDAIYERAGAFLRGEVEDPCKGAPVHLGGLMDSARMSPHKWRTVNCGDTGGQRFWELRS